MMCMAFILCYDKVLYNLFSCTEGVELCMSYLICCRRALPV
uniref:Uncharacterized protein n=1 Tax=Anguilla anguilla TaxID=7936 RepID=A0A0E9Q2P4_ANGAN